MSSKSKWAEELKNVDMKTTFGRVHILEELEIATQPISAENLYILLRNKELQVNLSTIYRTLELFVENAMVSKINILEDGRKLFALKGEKHCHYLVCKECNKIVTINSCPLGMYEKKLEEETGFSIDGHSLYLYGTCKKCLKNKNSGIVSEYE